MKPYIFIRQSLVYYKGIVYANSEEEASKLAEECDINDLYCEEECADLVEIYETTDKSVQECIFPVINRGEE